MRKSESKMSEHHTRNGVVAVQIQARLFDKVKIPVSVEKRQAPSDSGLGRESFLKKREFFEKTNSGEPVKPANSMQIRQSLAPVPLRRTNTYLMPSQSSHIPPYAAEGSTQSGKRDSSREIPGSTENNYSGKSGPSVKQGSLQPARSSKEEISIADSPVLTTTDYDVMSLHEEVILETSRDRQEGGEQGSMVSLSQTARSDSSNENTEEKSYHSSDDREQGSKVVSLSLTARSDPSNENREEKSYHPSYDREQGSSVVSLSQTPKSDPSWEETKSHTVTKSGSDDSRLHHSARTDQSRKENSSSESVTSNPSGFPQPIRSNLYKEETDGQAIQKKMQPNPEKARRHLEELEDAVTTCTDNLLKQTLLALRVLNMMPKSQKRNLPCCGSVAISLLGEAELQKVLPSKEVSIHVATWNMNGKGPPQPPHLKPWLLPGGLTDDPDVIVVGTQESHHEEDDWEVILQETIGPSHVMYHSTTFGTLHLVIFIRKELIWFLSVADEDTHSVRIGSAFRTKGAIAVAFYLFGTTFLFITSHLTAHEEKLKERIHDVKHIIKGLKLPHKLPCRHRDKDVTDNFDHVFWSGDLNFRLNRPRTEIIDWVSCNNFPLSEPAAYELDDQLLHSIKDGSTLHGFEEGPLTFAPTYKYDTGTSLFDTSSKLRTPSYTDRIVYKTNRAGPDTAVECVNYGSVHSITTSDHKPVWGRYKCPIQPGIDTIPLNAGFFNREVYLEAFKRRGATPDRPRSPSDAD